MVGQHKERRNLEGIAVWIEERNSGKYLPWQSCLKMI